MNLDSRMLAAPLADAAALLHNGVAYGAPASGVLNMLPALPVPTGSPTVKLGRVFAHAGLRTKHSWLALEIARWSLKLAPTPSAHSCDATPASHKRFTRFPLVRTGEGAESGALVLVPERSATRSAKSFLANLNHGGIIPSFKTQHPKQISQRYFVILVIDKTSRRRLHYS